MPIYEFACGKCRTLFSFYSRRVNTETTPSCPRCGGALSKQVSLFQAKSGGGRDADPWGLAGDGCDDDTASAPDFDIGDERVARAVDELGHRIDTMDDTDAAGAAKLMKEFSDKSGVKFGKDVSEALSRMAAGDDSESARNQLAEAMESGNPFDSGAQSQGDAAQTTAFAKDPTLYEM